jgi:two-component system alkaline phosphatase synthesis response regulator PhoP
MLHAGEMTVDLERRVVRVRGKAVELTATEFDLLAVLAKHPGRPFTRAQLVESVYDSSFDGYDRTIDAHIKNLRRKIEDDAHNPRYIQMVYGVGYRFAEIDEE